MERSAAASRHLRRQPHGQSAPPGWPVRPTACPGPALPGRGCSAAASRGRKRAEPRAVNSPPGHAPGPRRASRGAARKACSKPPRDGGREPAAGPASAAHRLHQGPPQAAVVNKPPDGRAAWGGPPAGVRVRRRAARSSTAPPGPKWRTKDHVGVRQQPSGNRPRRLQRGPLRRVAAEARRSAGPARRRPRREGGRPPNPRLSERAPPARRRSGTVHRPVPSGAAPQIQRGPPPGPPRGRRRRAKARRPRQGFRRDCRNASCGKQPARREATWLTARLGVMHAEPRLNEGNHGQKGRPLVQPMEQSLPDLPHHDTRWRQRGLFVLRPHEHAQSRRRPQKNKQRGKKERRQPV